MNVQQEPLQGFTSQLPLLQLAITDFSWSCLLAGQSPPGCRNPIAANVDNAALLTSEDHSGCRWVRCFLDSLLTWSVGAAVWRTSPSFTMLLDYWFALQLCTGMHCAQPVMEIWIIIWGRIYLILFYFFFFVLWVSVQTKQMWTS